MGSGQLIETTAEHPFWVVGRGWTPVWELTIGDCLTTITGETVSVEGVHETDRRETVYNLRVSDFHTYFVGCDEWGFSVWAHNAEYQVFADAYGTHSIRYWEGTGSSRTLKVLETPNGSPIRFKTAAEADAWIARNAKFNDLPAVRPRSVDRVDLPAGTRVHQSGKLDGVALNEPQIFAVNENGHLIHAPRGNPRTGAKHTELTGGGPAKAAGEFKLVGENKIQINNQSGRYIRQSPEGVQRVADYFKSLGYDVEIVTTAFP